jgi:TolC family type I secretion outer membrane protein
MPGTFLRITFVLFFVCFQWVMIPGGSGAGETSSLSLLTLEEAIKTGLEKNPMITVARFQVDASTARISQARSGLYPRIDFNESFVRTTSPAQAFSMKLNQEEITSGDFDPSRLNNPSAVQNFASTLSLSMPLYEAGQIRGGVEQAKLGQESASFSAERVRQEVITGVVAAYVGVLLAQDRLQVIHQTLETANANERMVRSRYQNGFVVKSDLLRAEVRLAELEQERLNARSRVDVARAVLNAAMGLETERDFQLVRLDEKDLSPPGSLDMWRRESMKNRPDIQHLRMQETIAEEELKKAKMAHLPSLYLTGSYEMNSENFSQTANNYTMGVLLRLNIFSGFGTESKVHEAVANLQQMRARVRQFDLAIEVETRQAFSQAQSSFERIKVAEAALNQAQEGLRIVRNRYENGLFTIVNLLDAEVSLQQAKTNHLRSLHDYKVAMAQLLLAAGMMDENFR